MHRHCIREKERINLNVSNLKHNRTYGKRLFTIIIIMSIMMIGTLGWRPRVQADDLPPMTVTVVALDGTQMVLNQSDIGNLTSYRAYGGFVKSNGALSNLGNYTGVPISTFLSIIGGISNGYSVKVLAPDGFSKTLSYEALNGTGLLTYDNVTGQVVQHNQTLTPMLAYFYNDANLTSGGPLRLAIVGPEGLLTQSSLWVSNVVRLEMHPNLQPMNLTVVALNGTSLSLDQTAISNLPAIRYAGGFRNKLGLVKSLGNHTGPSLNTLCSLVGGVGNDTSLRITASDGYTQTLSYDMVNGAFATYDNVTGNPVQHNQPLTPILAYHFNDANLTSGVDGPLELAIVGPEGVATPSSYWVKNVVKLELRYIDDVAVTAISPSSALVGQGYFCNLNVTVANPGGYDETFNVTAYANLTAIGAQNVTLSAGNSTIIMFAWNTSGFALGNYAIEAVADTVPGETNTTNNALAYNQIRVTIPGDLNGDFQVTLADLTILAHAYGSHPGDPNWNSNADLALRGVIDLTDLVTLAYHYGQHYP
jgi:hypothetical protein